MFTYNAEITQDEDDRYVVTFPNLPYGVTDGATIEEALFEAVDCLDEVIAGIIESDEPIPESVPAETGQYIIPLSALMSAKAALYTSMRDKGLTKVAVASRINRNEKEVRRMLDPHHNTKIKSIEQALHVMGKRLKVTVEDEDCQVA